jgi:HIRAN domain
MTQPLPGRWSLKIKGITFQPDYPANLHRLQALVVATAPFTSVAARLEREPGNEHDPNAIVVLVDGIGRLGHVPRGVAARLAPEMDAGSRWAAEVTDVLVHPDHPDRHGITVTFRRMRETFDA